MRTDHNVPRLCQIMHTASMTMRTDHNVPRLCLFTHTASMTMRTDHNVPRLCLITHTASMTMHTDHNVPRLCLIMHCQHVHAHRLYCEITRTLSFPWQDINPTSIFYSAQLLLLIFCWLPHIQSASKTSTWKFGASKSPKHGDHTPRPSFLTKARTHSRSPPIPHTDPVPFCTPCPNCVQSVHARGNQPCNTHT